MSNNEAIIPIIEEQLAVQFTGKVNVLDGKTSQFKGVVTLYEGDLVNVQYHKLEGVKAFYHLVIDDFEHCRNTYVVEPEIVANTQKKIPFPFSVLKSKLTKIMEQYFESKQNRPPDSIRLKINPSIIEEGDELTGEEYELLRGVLKYKQVKDIYEKHNLLDFEITNALVSLRKKQALKVVK